MDQIIKCCIAFAVIELVISKSIGDNVVVQNNLKLPTYMKDNHMFEVKGILDSANEKFEFALRSGDYEDFNLAFHFANKTLKLWPDSKEPCHSTDFPSDFSSGDLLNFVINVTAREFDSKHILDVHFKVNEVFDTTSCVVGSFKTSDNVNFGGVKEIHNLTVSFKTPNDT